MQKVTVLTMKGLQQLKTWKDPLCSSSLSQLNLSGVLVAVWCQRASLNDVHANDPRFCAASWADELLLGASICSEAVHRGEVTRFLSRPVAKN